MLEIKCDSCKSQMYSGDYVYCYDCHEADSKTILELQDEIDNLKREIESLENQL